MAETAGRGTSIPPRPLISLEPEERRKVLLESLCTEYTPIREVFHTEPANESRYISQFTSRRWREHIHQSSIVEQSSEDGSEDALKEDPQKLVMYGYDLQSQEHRREAEMIMRWNFVEREKHFPNLEKGYMEKRKAKNQVKGQDVGIPQSPQPQDVTKKEHEVLPSTEVVLETPPKSTKEVEVGQSSEVPLQEPSRDTAMAQSPESPDPKPQNCQESPEACKEIPQTVPEACKETLVPSETQSPDIQKTSVNLQEGTDDTKENASVAEDCKLAESSKSKMETSEADSKLAKGSESDDSKLAKRASESEMETSGATSRGKRKADSAATSDGEDPDEKRTKKTSGDK